MGVVRVHLPWRRPFPARGHVRPGLGRIGRFMSRRAGGYDPRLGGIGGGGEPRGGVGLAAFRRLLVPGPERPDRKRRAPFDVGGFMQVQFAPFPAALANVGTVAVVGHQRATAHQFLRQRGGAGPFPVVAERERPADGAAEVRVPAREFLQPPLQFPGGKTIDSGHLLRLVHEGGQPDVWPLAGGLGLQRPRIEDRENEVFHLNARI